MEEETAEQRKEMERAKEALDILDTQTRIDANRAMAAAHARVERHDTERMEVYREDSVSRREADARDVERLEMSRRAEARDVRREVLVEREVAAFESIAKALTVIAEIVVRDDERNK